MCFSRRYLDHAESVEEKSSSEGEKDQPENMEKKEKIEQNIKSLSISCHLNRAACKLKLGDNAGAVVDCNEVLDEDEKNAKALFRKGQANANMSDFEQAMDFLQAASNLHPEDKSKCFTLSSEI